MSLSSFMLRAIHFLFLSIQNTELFTCFQNRTVQNLDSELNLKFINTKKNYFTIRIYKIGLFFVSSKYLAKTLHRDSNSILSITLFFKVF